MSQLALLTQVPIIPVTDDRAAGGAGARLLR
jgi:hypothetical protein